MSQEKSDLEISAKLVEKGLITQNQLTQALEYQCRLPPGQYTALPQVLIDFEFVTEAQIRHALGEAYNALDDPIAQILIQEGILSAQQLHHAMEILNAFPTQHIVDILVDLGLVSNAQIEQTISNYQLKQSKLFVRNDASLQGLKPAQTEKEEIYQEEARSPEPTVHMPLGRILVAKGWITQSELDQVLEYQRRLPKVLHKHLGEILIEQGYLDQAQLDDALASQPQKQTNRIGDLLVNAGVINEGQLAHALSLQFSPEHAHKKLGHLLLELGYTSRDRIEAALATPAQVPASTAPPTSAPVSDTPAKKPLGQILREKGYISEAQLQAALDFQKSGGSQDYRPLGDILVLMGAISESQLQEALTAQPEFKQLPIGQILVKYGLIAEWQLAHALCVQFEPGRPHITLGALLVELGYTNQDAIEETMLKHFRQSQGVG
ncbi:MAG: hypothetical protein AB7I41_10320 [Candidatus Sericytochromatia bacterium]